jgi:2C-methyl-D-erythritol 2,4-cyclodiphosphate synthase
MVVVCKHALVMVPVLVLLLAIGLTAGVAVVATSLDSAGESRPIFWSRGDHHRGIKGLIREVSEVLNLEASEVAAQLREGNTLAQIIEEHGSTVEAVVEDLTAEQRERLQEAVNEGRITQEEMDERLARLEERYTRVLNSERLGRLAERASHWRFAAHQRSLVRGVADVLGLEVSEVAAQLREGKTLAQVIEDNGSTAEEVVDAMVEDIRARLLERLSAAP